MMEPALAQATDGSVVVAPPGWERLPNGEDMWRVHPPEARRKRVAGRAMLICKVAAAGRLTDCRTDFVEPAGYGFGEAALKLAPIFRLRMNIDGQSTAGGTMHIPVRFAPSKPTLPVELAALCYGYAERLAAANPASAGAERRRRYWRYRYPDALKEAGEKVDPSQAMAEARAREALRSAELREADPRRRCESLVPGPEG